MSESNYQLIDIRPEDWEPIRQWRNAQLDILRQNKPITQEEQIKYSKHNDPQKCLYSFLCNGKLIGYGGLVHIDYENKRAEISFLLEPERIKDKHLYRKELIAFHNPLRETTEDMGIHRWHAETFEHRLWHIHCLEEFGFEYEGRLHDHVIKNGQYVDVIIHGKRWNE